MNAKNLDSWARSHFDFFLDAVRIYLGIGLIFKGIYFLTHGDALNNTLTGTGLASFVSWVPYVHVVGGALLAIGLLPRIAALAQIPILFAAVFLVNFPLVETVRGREAVEFSALVLFLLVLIAIKPLSLPGYWKQKHEPRHTFAFQRWLDERPDVFADMVRIYLGVGLFLKGMYILNNRGALFDMLNSQGGNLSLSMAAAAHYVIPVHFVGGVLLAIGLLTRIAALAQLPPLIGAVFYIFLPRFTALEMRQSFEFTALVLFLLSLIAIFGAGRWSIENYGRKTTIYTPLAQPAH